MATVLTDAGKAISSGLVTKVTTLDPKYIGIGSGAGTAAVADTTLFTEYTTGTWTGYARTSAAGTQVTGSVTNDSTSHVGTFTAGAAQTVTNAGNFDALTAGNAFVKGDFTGVALGIGDSIQVTIKLRYA